MRLKLLGSLTVVCCFLFLSGPLKAQSCIPTNINGTTINLLCNQACSTLVFQIPHIKSSDDYTLVSIPYTPYPYNTPTGQEDPVLYNDDQYSFLINIPFNFCFYGANYNSTVVGSNGIMTFDPANTSCANNYVINNTIPWAGGTICSIGSGYYAKASIMGAYSDLDPRYPTASPAERKIQWEVIGTAPCRKFVVSYYHIGVYGNTCGFSTPNTFQMVIYESTGIIEIFTQQKACFSTTNNGRGVQGIQDFNRIKAVSVPGRNNTSWSDNNSAYRFVPSAGTSRFVSSELDDMSGTLIMPADTLTTVPGLLDIRFPNACFPAGSNQYVVKTIFSACDNAFSQLISYDTITVSRLNSLGATAATTSAGCGLPNGTITVTVPPGVGTPPYTFVLDGVTTFVGASPYTFTNVAAGPHTIVVTDFTGGCNSTINATVALSGNIPATTTTNPTACSGVNNGSITITSAGGSGPYTFSLDGAPAVPGTIPFTFSNLSSGNHTIMVNDLGLGCSTVLMTVNVPAGLGVTGSATTTATTCAGVNNGTIIVTALTGVAPFTWQLDANPAVPGASPYTFTNVSSGAHSIRIFDNLGCVGSVNVIVSAGPGINGSTTTTPTTCPAASNGSIIATALSGNAPYTWSLDGAPPVGGPSPYTFNNVSAGLHTVTIIDNNGCNVVLSVSVAAGPGINGSTTSTATSCPGVSNGTIIATALTGTAPFTWSLDGGAAVPGASPHTFPNVAAGLHTVTITDNNGCNVLLTETVTTGAGNTGSATSTATSCPAVSNGTIIATALTGTAPFTWQLDGGGAVPGASPYTFPNVAAGPHTVTINDNVGCSAIVNVTVNAGAGNTGSATSTATSCPAVSNGTIIATALTGTAPFTWQLDGGGAVPGPSPYTFPNVAAGPHTVTINDNVGCSVIVNVTVNAGAGNTGSATSTATSCPAVSNGTIIATALTGTAPFTWSLDGGAAVPGASPHTFPNVAAGPHTVTINDNVGCTAIVNVTVNAGAGNTGSANSTATSCPAVSNGTIIATALTGTAPFSWQLDGGGAVPGVSPHTFPNVAAGPHTVTINDNIGCTAIVNVTVIAGAGNTGSATSTATSCPAVSNGTIIATALTGTAPFTWQLDGGGAVPGASPHTFPNVAAGPHTVTINDNIGCSVVINVTVTAGAGNTGIATSTATSCPAVSDGTIIATALTGTAPFTWQLDGGGAVPGASPHTFPNVAAGPHTVTINDNVGCSVVVNVTVTAGPPLAATVTPAATTCSGASDGTIAVTPTNGVAPYTYSLDGGAPVAAPGPYTFINIAAGNHTVVVSDAAGCVSSIIPVVVNAGPILTTTVTVTDALCNGGATGVITVTQPAIGAPPYQYSLDGVTWQASNIFNGLIAGNYTVYYRESLGCQGSQPVTVNQPAGMTSSAATVPAICNGQNNGTITVTTGGGVTPYQYSIDGGVTWQASNIFNVAAGNYTIIIRDANNCTKNQLATVTEPPPLAASSVNGNASCNGGNDGVITVSVLGGNVPYSYSIDGVNFQPSNVFNVTPGNYTVTIKDNLGCGTTFNTVVGLTNNLTVTPQTDATICEGTSTQLQLISNATVYSWTPSTGLSNTAISNPVANPTVTTQYTVTATLGLCSANDDVIVNVNPAPIPDAGPPGSICFGQTYQLQGSGGVQYTWTPSTYLNSTTISDPVSTPVKTITYTLSQVIDAIGCKSLTTDQVTIDVTPPIKVKTFPYDTIGYPGDQFQLNATSAATTYSWSPATGLSNPNIPNPVVTVGPIGSDILYQVIASTAAGCKGEGYVNLKVYKGPELYIPNAFTPNGDGLNDLFYPFPVGIRSINYFKVFNRWGQLLFSSNVLYKGWDGKMQGVEQPSGVYVYMAQGVDKNGNLLTRKGTVTLIR